MNTVSNIREEKRVAELQAERFDAKAQKRIEERIEWCESEIQKENQNIIFAAKEKENSLVISACERIKKLIDKKVSLQIKLAG